MGLSVPRVPHVTPFLAHRMRTQDSYPTTLAKDFPNEGSQSKSEEKGKENGQSSRSAPLPSERDLELQKETKYIKEKGKEEETEKELDEGPVINYVKMEILFRMMVRLIFLSPREKMFCEFFVFRKNFSLSLLLLILLLLFLV